MIELTPLVYCAACKLKPKVAPATLRSQNYTEKHEQKTTTSIETKSDTATTTTAEITKNINNINNNNKGTTTTNTYTRSSTSTSIKSHPYSVQLPSCHPSLIDDGHVSFRRSPFHLPICTDSRLIRSISLSTNGDA